MLPETAVHYPAQSLGRLFRRALDRWGIPEARLARYLGVGDVVVAALALCPVPDVADVGDADRHLAKLAMRFGVDPVRLGFLYRAGCGEVPRLRRRR